MYLTHDLHVLWWEKLNCIMEWMWMTRVAGQHYIRVYIGMTQIYIHYTAFELFINFDQMHLTKVYNISVFIVWPPKLIRYKMFSGNMVTGNINLFDFFFCVCGGRFKCCWRFSRLYWSWSSDNNFPSVFFGAPLEDYHRETAFQSKKNYGY